MFERGLSTRTIDYANAVLRSAFLEAVRKAESFWLREFKPSAGAVMFLVAIRSTYELFGTQ